MSLASADRAVVAIDDGEGKAGLVLLVVEAGKVGIQIVIHFVLNEQVLQIT